MRALLLTGMLATALLPDLDDTRDFAECFQALTPLPRVRMLPWCQANIVTDAGRPYDHAAYPHLGAPGGPMDAFDDPNVRTITKQWGVRLGKTFFGQCAHLKTAATDPAPQMFVSSREKLAKEVTQRTYDMLRKSPPLAGLLVRHARLQKQDLIEYRGCKQYVGWAKSASTLADKNIKVGHANEVDKWDQPSTSTEGDPLDLFEDRFNDYWITRKVIIEGTPAVKGRSRIERKRLAGWNCSYHVPCPHCRTYQVLEFGEPAVKHGIKWDRGPDGRQNPDLARKTARYVCQHCQARIESDSRPWMMRRGVWAPEGCTVVDDVALAITEGRQAYAWRGWKHAAWVQGTPLRDGEDASYHLSSLYALAIPEWGDFAKRFLKAQGKPQSLRTFINQWLAKTWELASRQQTWEDLGKRLIVSLPPRRVPAGYSLLTCGIDKQADHYPFQIDAWGPERRVHTLLYGSHKTLDELAVLLRETFRRDDLVELAIALTLIDTGYRPADVYRFCRKARAGGLPVLPCKGSSSPLNTFCVRSRLNDKSTAPGQEIVLVDTNSTQDWIDEQLHVLKPADAGSRTLFEGSLADHQDYLEQLLNDAAVPDLDTTNNARERWQRIDENTPNDFRDCGRYSFAARMLVTRGRDGLPPLASAPESPPSSRLRMPDGRPFLLTER